MLRQYTLQALRLYSIRGRMAEKNNRRRVAVIGAGVSGLATIKSCLEDGLHPVCFEQFNSIGGVWQFTEKLLPNQGGAVHASLLTNSSKEMSCFSDFPPPKDFPVYPTGSDFMHYIYTYAQHFDLLKYIRFRHRVIDVTPAPDHDVTGKWQVQYQPMSSEESESGLPQTEVFDSVAVCSGPFKKPIYPSIEGLSNFQNEVMHSHSFRKTDVFTGKIVLVIGNANSAGDIATEAAKVAKKVYLSVGQGTWVLSKFVSGGVPLDMLIITQLFSMAPKFLVDLVTAYLANSYMDHVTYGLRPPKTLSQGASVMVNDELRVAIATGKVVIKAHVSSFTKTGATFQDQTCLEHVDIVAFATGFRHEFKFLSKSIVPDDYKDFQLYRLTFPIYMEHHTLAIVGCISTIGPMVPCLELQARWAARVFSGHSQLPSEQQMIKETATTKAKASKTCGFPRPRPSSVKLRNEIAKEIGVLPSFWNLLLTDPKLAMNVFLGPVFPVHHRLVGPHSWPGARAAALSAYDNVVAATRTRHVTTPPVCRNSVRLLLVAGIVAFVALIAHL